MDPEKVRSNSLVHTNSLGVSMSDPNPYAYGSPDVDEYDDIEDDGGEYELASPWYRLGAQMVDGLALAIPGWALIFGILGGILNIDLFTQRFVPLEEQIQISAISAGVYGILYLVFNGYLLATQGQTIGKLACKIRIVKNDGSIPPLTDTYIKRYLSTMIIGNIPIVGLIYVLVDILMIFRADHKCLHDIIAGTMVISNKKKRPKRSKNQDDDLYDDDEADEEEEEEDSAGMRLILPVGRSGWAIASGYLALFSILIIPAPLALITGILGVREIRANPKKHGMGRAIFGIIMGGLGTAVLLLIIVSILFKWIK